MVTIDKNKTCRTCLEDCEEVTTTIYDKIKRTMSTTIVELLRDFTFIKMSDFEDQLPLSICSNCYQKIKSCYEFKLLCQKSENIILQQLKINLQTQAEELTIKSEPTPKNISDSTVSCVNENKNLNINEDFSSEPFIKIEEIKNELILEKGNENNVILPINYENDMKYNTDSDQSVSNGNDSHDEDYIIGSSEENLMVKQSGDSLRKTQENEETRTICLACNSEFENEEQFYRHAEVKHKKLRIFKSKTYTVDSIHLREVYYCTKCKMIIYNRREFVDHIIEDHKQEPCECPECYAIFEDVSVYKVHLLKCFKEIVDCRICNMTFITRKNYNIHKMKIKHEKDGYLCPYCGFFQHNVSVYNVHLRIHTGEKPYSCDICDKSFHDRSSLRSHKACNHSDERNYVCSKCGAGFKTNSAVNAHLRIHGGEKKNECTICGLKFLRRQHLKKHYTVHSDERNETCSYCNKSYKTKTALSLHMKLHTGKNMHVCSICDKSFIQRVLLRGHIKKFHQIEKV